MDVVLSRLRSVAPVASLLRSAGVADKKIREDKEVEGMSDEGQILDTQTLEEARAALDRSQGGDSLSRLAECACILVGGFLDKLIEESER